MARSINDIEAIEDFIAHGIPETALATVIPISMITVLFYLNPELALIAILPIPLAAVLVLPLRVQSACDVAGGARAAFRTRGIGARQFVGHCGDQILCPRA